MVTVEDGPRASSATTAAMVTLGLPPHGTEPELVTPTGNNCPGSAGNSPGTWPGPPPWRTEDILVKCAPHSAHPIIYLHTTASIPRRP